MIMYNSWDVVMTRYSDNPPYNPGFSDPSDYYGGYCGPDTAHTQVILSSYWLTLWILSSHWTILLILSSDWSILLIFSSNCQPKQHQLPVDRGDSETHSPERCEDVILQRIKGDGLHSAENIRNAAFWVIWIKTTQWLGPPNWIYTIQGLCSLSPWSDTRIVI